MIELVFFQRLFLKVLIEINLNEFHWVYSLKCSWRRREKAGNPYFSELTA
jgi:hypothetical protein